ncbi:MAG: hypothetical protein ABIH08_02460, partial [Candidatus Omnitrophota bacterium]
MKSFKIAKSLISLDIGLEEIRIVDGNIEAAAPTPKGAVRDGIIIAKEETARTIKSLLKDNNINNKNVITVIKGKDVILRLMSVLPAGPEKIKET